jgi:DNA uptake protein ComE-like DNA-binding protein
MFKRFFREYLSLSSGERRGFLVLVSIVFILVIIRALLPGILAPSRPYHAVPAMHLPAGEEAEHAAMQGEPPDYFQFDPNTAGLDTLLRLGVPDRVARTWINYRKSGGRFRSVKDLRRIYGMDMETYLQIEPWIRLPAAATPGPGPQAKESVPDLSPRVSLNPAVTDHETLPFELNRADTNMLVGVRGIGPVFAARIVKFRELLGGFHSMEQLREVYGLSDYQYRNLYGSCVVDSSLVRVMDLNCAAVEELEGHPYLDEYHARALFSYRSAKGRFDSIGEVLDNRLLPPEVMLKVSPYLGIGEE